MLAGGVAGALVLPEVAAFAAQREDATKHIIYSLSRQRVWLMEGKPFRVLDTYKVSGRTDIPEPGRYSVYSRSPRAWSTISIGVEWNWMIRFAYSPKGYPIGFHEIPERKVDGKWVPLQSEAELGIRRSSGCVRQARDKARFLWKWAPIGTRVIVTR